MACDIHIHQEVKINGKWEHYRETSFPRDYEAFAKMAGVRGASKPIAEPRGLPEDATTMTKFAADYAAEDGHTHSWLGAAEILQLEEWFNERMRENKWQVEMNGFGYLFGNSWSNFTRYPSDRPVGLEDVRFVFWFDN